MSSWSALIAGNGKNIGRKNVIWNIAGSLAYSLLSVLLLMVVNRAAGEEQAGVFSIAFTTGQLMLTLGFYNMHPFQATDIRGEYSFQDYFTTRCITCAAMILLSAVYIALSGYTFEKALIVALLCLYKMFDGLSDVYESQFQQQGVLHIAGKAMLFRALLSGGVFCLVIFATKNLVVSCISLVLTGALGFFLFEMMASEGLFRTGLSKSGAKVGKILWFCFPLCLSSFMSNYITNAPKYSIDRLMTEAYQAHYGMIFMPAYTINLCSTFVFKPLLTTMAEQWAEKRYPAFRRLLLRLSFYIVLITLAALIVGWFWGLPVLSWFYATDLSGYQWPFMVILLGGGLSAVNILIFYALTVMRRQRRAFWGYLVTFAVSWILPPLAVERFGLLGAAAAYTFLTLFLDLSFFVLFLTSYRKCVKTSGGNREAENGDG